MGETTASFEADAADPMIRLITHELPQTGLLVLGRHLGPPKRFTRRLTLRRLPDGEVLLREIHERRKAQAMRPRRRPLPVADWLRRGYEQRQTC